MANPRSPGSDQHKKTLHPAQGFLLPFRPLSAEWSSVSPTGRDSSCPGALCPTLWGQGRKQKCSFWVGSAKQNPGCPGCPTFTEGTKIAALENKV